MDTNRFQPDEFAILTGYPAPTADRPQTLHSGRLIDSISSAMLHADAGYHGLIIRTHRGAIKMSEMQALRDDPNFGKR